MEKYHKIFFKKRRQEITNVSEDVKSGNPWTLLVRMYMGAATVENNMEVPQKNRNITTM